MINDPQKRHPGRSTLKIIVIFFAMAGLLRFGEDLALGFGMTHSGAFLAGCFLMVACIVGYSLVRPRFFSKPK